MTTLDPTRYPPAVAELLQVTELMPLGPGRPNAEARARLAALSDESLLAGGPVRDRDMAAACRAGLWLLHNFLDESHTISQEIRTPTGSYWHGILHRREPDFGNAKYWFHRVGTHPVFGPLAEAVRELAAEEKHRSAAFLKTETAWDPFAFIDLCEASSNGRVPCESLCRAVQHCEWELLFDWCYRQAAGPS